MFYQTASIQLLRAGGPKGTLCPDPTEHQTVGQLCKLFNEQLQPCPRPAPLRASGLGHWWGPVSLGSASPHKASHKLPVAPHRVQRKGLPHSPRHAAYMHTHRDTHMHMHMNTRGTHVHVHAHAELLEGSRKRERPPPQGDRGSWGLGHPPCLGAGTCLGSHGGCGGAGICPAGTCH